MPDSPELHFEASAYLQTLLGRELFRSEQFAIVELVKNAYDSGATRVEIFISPPSGTNAGELIVSDDGSGMARSDFERLFMVAGYSERPEQLRRVRVPTGEKGVGRFAADRLGKDLDIYTRTRADKAILHAKIDWTHFYDRRKKFNEITARVDRVSVRPRAITDSHGTVLRIGRLRSNWEPAQLLEVRRALEQLLDPFEPPDGFELEFVVDRSAKLSGRIKPAVIGDGDLSLRFTVGAGGRVRRKWLGPQVPAGRPSERSVVGAELAGLRGRFVYFLKRPARTQVADFEAGVRMYRDGFRMEPFGHPKADWLGIEEKR